MSTATKHPMPIAVYRIWVFTVDALIGGGWPWAPSRYIITMLRPFSRAASGSSNGSAHGAKRRMTRCAAAMPNTVDGGHMAAAEGGSGPGLATAAGGFLCCLAAAAAAAL